MTAKGFNYRQARAALVDAQPTQHPPTWPQASPVLTNEEAVRYLRLDVDHPHLDDAIRALHRLVRERGLRPLRYGITYKFLVAELDRFIAADLGTTDAMANGRGGGTRADFGGDSHVDSHVAIPLSES